MQSKNTKLSNASKKISKKHDEIEDIVLFGSVMRGKEKPNDIDIAIIFRNNVKKEIEKEFRDLLDEKNMQVVSTTREDLDKERFIAKEGLYLEGVSLITGEKLSSSLGFESYGIIKYDISKLKGSKRTKFYHAIHGRKSIGLLKRTGAKKFSDNMIICKYANIENLKEFFENQEISHVIFPILTPKRLSHIILK